MYLFIKQFLARAVLTALCLVTNIKVQAQSYLPKIDSLHIYGFERMDTNKICYPEHMSKCFEKLYKQKRDSTEVIRIVHIGDSHIQADMMTRIVRTQLQEVFGSAGRGLITPYKVAATNEPFTYRTSSLQLWEANRCVQKDITLPIGIAGLTLRSSKAGSEIAIDVKHEPSVDHSFDKVCIYFEKDSNSCDFEILDKDKNSFGRIYCTESAQYKNYGEICLPAYQSKIFLKTLPSSTNKTKATLYGISLENSNSGLLYHMIGINGAKYSDYDRLPLFIEQVSTLRPDLFIISLGTNEANSNFITEDDYRKSVISLVDKLKAANPNAEFLLTSPPPSYYKKVNPNAKVLPKVATLNQLAKERQMAFWNLYEVYGTNKALSTLKQLKLLTTDGIHYTLTGYEHQGKLFSLAILNAYYQYVADRSR